jgi:hypothetical protein
VAVLAVSTLEEKWSAGRKNKTFVCSRVLGSETLETAVPIAGRFQGFQSFSILALEGEAWQFPADCDFGPSKITRAAYFLALCRMGA